MDTALSDATRSVWGKTDRKNQSLIGWLPLWRHLADSADVAGRLWDHWLSPATRRLISADLPGGDEDGRRLARWLAGIHDVGKATPAFACQAPHLTARMHDHGLHWDQGLIATERKRARHEYAGHHILSAWLVDRGWPDPDPYAVIVGGHHGSPPTDEILNGIRLRTYLLGDPAWSTVQHELLAWMTDRTGATERLDAWSSIPLSQPAQAALTGLVIVADWIASNEDYFPYTLDTSDEDRLDAGWQEIGLPTPWRPTATAPVGEQLFAERFTLPPGAKPRPVQLAVSDLAATMPAAGIMIVEAAMGEGKTEAALAAVEILARRTDAAGCYIALPTRATSDAMFARVLAWLQRLPDAQVDRGNRDVRLAHGKAAFNADYHQLRYRSLPSGIAQDEGGSQIGVNKWLAGPKRTMLSSFVIGTIDQLLFSALRSKHLVLRHLGLTGKVVVIDEAHAYDVYMGRFLDRALEWLGAYGVPVVVLSATLPAHRRAELLEAYDRGRLGPPPKLTWRDRGKTPVDAYADLRSDRRYPLISVSTEERGGAAITCADSGRSIEVNLQRLEDSTDSLITLLREKLADGGCALVIHNTVARVQETAATLRAAFGDDIPVTVAHSRFMAIDRAGKDRWLRDTFGPDATHRPARHIVVASQVAEQSLDIDFDLLVTDLAPVDLVLQRIGRLHRHPRTDRPPLVSTPACWITGADWHEEPPAPAAGSRRVYQPSVLLRSAAVLLPHLGGRTLHIPGDIAELTQTAYGDGLVGPASWQETMAQAAVKDQEERDAKQLKADSFRLAAVGEPGTSLIGWLEGGVGNADDRAAQGHVRDTDSETLEVLLLVRTPAGLVTPPWIDGGGQFVPVDSEPDWRLARKIAQCTLPLPRSMTDPAVVDAVIADLEGRLDLRAWQKSHWLAGELVLDVDDQLTAAVASFQLQYDPTEGLRLMRTDG